MPLLQMRFQGFGLILPFSTNNMNGLKHYKICHRLDLPQAFDGESNVRKAVATLGA